MDRLFKTKSKVVTRKMFDRFGLTTYGETWNCSAEVFALRCLWQAKNSDIIHVHGFDKIIPFLKTLYPRKPVIIHYHGSTVWRRWKSKQKYWRKANFILYSTKDLVSEDTPNYAAHLPNPVDTDLFHPLTTRSKPKTAFHFSYFADDLAVKYAEKYGLSLTIHNRETNPIPHTLLPNVLCKHEYYIDVKRNVEGRLMPSLSKTGLEALACGLKVIKWNGEVIKGLPIEHRPESVVNKLYRLYINLISK